MSRPRTTSAPAGALSSGKTPRRRRKPEAAESEILDAAARFLREHPFRDMTVDNMMAATGLSRPSFYEYFRDRHHLIIKLIERFGPLTYTVGERWLSGGDSGNEPIEALREGVQKLVELYSRRGYLLRALADAASNDKLVESAYREMTGRNIEATAARIRVGIRNGAIEAVHPKEIATALILFNDRYLMEKFGREPHPDREIAAETLLTVWKRVLYGI